MYSPIVAMLVAAEKATELPRLGNPKMKLRVQASHTGGQNTNEPKEIHQAIIPTSSNRRLSLGVDLMEEFMTRDTSVPGKGIHHTGICRHREGSI
jgi:hypothetical protein